MNNGRYIVISGHRVYPLTDDEGFKTAGEAEAWAMKNGMSNFEIAIMYNNKRIYPENMRNEWLKNIQ